MPGEEAPVQEPSYSLYQKVAIYTYALLTQPDTQRDIRQFSVGRISALL